MERGRGEGPRRGGGSCSESRRATLPLRRVMGWALASVATPFGQTRICPKAVARMGEASAGGAPCLVCTSALGRQRDHVKSGFRFLGGGGGATEPPPPQTWAAANRYSGGQTTPRNPHNPQYADDWAPLTRKRHIPPPPTQPRNTNDWAPRTRTHGGAAGPGPCMRPPQSPPPPTTAGTPPPPDPWLDPPQLPPPPPKF